MVKRLPHEERALLIAAGLFIGLGLALLPALALNEIEIFLLGALSLGALIYQIVANRLAAQHGWAALARYSVPLNTVMLSLAFGLIYPHAPIAWIIYLIIPLHTALLFGANWAYVGGGLSVLGYTAAMQWHGTFALDPNQHLLVSGFLLAFALVGGSLAEIARREQAAALANLRARETAETQLRDSQAELAAIFAAMHDVIMILDADGRYLSIAPTTPSTLLYRPARDTLGKTLHEIFPLAHADYFLAHIRRALAAEQPIHFEYRLTIAAQEKWFAATIARMDTRRVLLAARDITPLKHSELALHRRDAILAAIAFAAERFLGATTWESGIHAVLAQLGQATEVSRVYLFENTTRADGTLVTSQRYEWTAPNITPQVDNPALQNLPYLASGFARWVDLLAHGKVIHGNLSSLPPSEQALLAAQDVRSVMIMPIFIGAAWWGFIGFDMCVTEREWLDVEIEALETAANALGAAIERQRADHELETRANFLAVLNDITRAGIAVVDLPAMLQLFADRLGELFGASACYLSLWDETRRQPIPSVAYGPLRGKYAALRPDANRIYTTEIILQAGKTLVIPELAQTTVIPEYVRAQFGEHAAACIGVPLIADEQPLGSLIVTFAAPRQFAPDEINRAEQAAAQIALAIAKARAAEAERAQLLLAHTLEEMGKLLTTQLGLDQVLTTILDLLARVIRYDSVSILLLDQNGLMNLAAARGYPDLERARVSMREMNVTRFRKQFTQEPFVVIPDTYADNRWQIKLGMEYIRSWIGAPLRIKGRFIGFLNVDNQTAHAYTLADGTTVAAFADQAVIAIENARLSRSIQESEEQYRTLVEDIPLGMYRHTTGAIGKIVMANSAFLQMFGWHWDTDPTTLTIDDLFAHAADRTALMEQLQAQGSLNGVEVQFKRRDGTPLWGLLTARMSYEGNAPAFFDCTIQDITARKHADENLREKVAALQTLNEIERALTSTLSLSEQMDRLLEHALAQMRGDMGSVSLIHPDKHELRILAYRGTHYADLWRDFTLPIGAGVAGWIAQHAAPAAIIDVTQDARWVPAETSAREGLVSYLGVPLQVEDRVIGVLDLAMRSRREFSAAEIEFFQTLAGQAAIAIHNARLFEETQQRANEFAALYATARTLAEQSDPTDLLHTIVQRAVSLLGAAGGCIFRYDAPHGDLAIAVRENYPLPPDIRIRLGEGMTGLAAQQLAPVLVDDYHTWARRLPQADAIPFRASVAVPMLFAGELLGVLDVAELGDSPRKFTEADARLLTLFAAQAASALHNARLLEEARHHAEQIVALNTASLEIQRHLDSHEILLTACAELQHFGKFATTFLLTSEQRLQHVHTSMSPDILEQFVARFGAQDLPLHLPLESLEPLWTHLCARQVVIESAQALHRLDKISPKWCTLIAWLDAFVMEGKIILAPLTPAGTVTGFVAVIGDQLDTRDLPAIALFARHVSAALENARLLEETQQRAAEQTAISEIARALNATLDVQEAFPTIVKNLRALCDCERVSLALLDEAMQQVVFVALDQPRTEMGQGTRLPLYATAAAADVLAGHVHQTPDLGTETSFPAEAVLYEAGFRSRINLPLLTGDQVLGALNLVSRRTHAFALALVPALQQIANAIAIALTNSRLFQAEQARRSELAALYDLARMLAVANDADTILELVARYTALTLPTTFARAALLEQDAFVVRSGYPIRSLACDLEIGAREPLDDYPLYQEMLARHTAIVVRHSDPLSVAGKTNLLFFGKAKTICAVPIRVGTRIAGCLLIGEARHEAREDYTPEKLRLANSIAEHAANALHRIELFSELENAYLQAVVALAKAADAKDTYTADHSQRLAEMATTLGRAMQLSARELDDLRYGAILHDIGKIGIPDVILLKPGALEPSERVRMQQHPEIGAHILEPLPRLTGAAQIVRHHHERYDGTGYPDGLQGEAIPIGARILSIVDTYSAIMDRRVYKEGAPHAFALAEIQRCAGTQFDPRITTWFVRLFQSAADCPPPTR